MACSNRAAIDRRDELIALPDNRLDVRRAVRLRPEQLAQGADDLGNGVVGDGRAPPHLVGQLPLGDETSGSGDQNNERVNLPIGRKNLFASPKETTTVRIELEWTETIDPGPDMHVGAAIIASGAHAKCRMRSKIMQACTKNLEWVHCLST